MKYQVTKIGTMTTTVEANSEEEARQKIRGGQNVFWEDEYTTLEVEEMGNDVEDLMDRDYKNGLYIDTGPQAWDDRDDDEGPDDDGA